MSNSKETNVEKSHKSRKKKSNKRFIWLAIFIICLAVFGFYMFKIYDWDQDNRQIEKILKEDLKWQN